MFNGIKPNAFVYLPQFKYKSETTIRESEPEYHETIRETVDQLTLKSLRRIKVEVYHEDKENEILIGEGYLEMKESMNRSFSQSNLSNSYKVIIDSRMSKRLQAYLEIKVEIGQIESTQFD